MTSFLRAAGNHVDVRHLTELLQDALGDDVSGSLTIQWVLRYAVVDVTRSVVRNLGYIVATQRKAARA